MTEIPFPLMPSATIEHTGWGLLHSVWQFAAIAALIFVGDRLLQKASSSARYTLLLTGLFLLTIAPVVTWFILPRPLESEPVTKTEASAPVLLDEFPIPDAGAVQPSPVFKDSTLKSSEIDDSAAVPSATSIDDGFTAKWHERLANLLQPWLSTIVVLWCAGCCCFLFARLPVG